MANEPAADKADEKKAQHTGEDREHGKLEPGSGLDRRQDRNTEHTGKTSEGGPHATAPDLSNP